MVARMGRVPGEAEVVRIVHVLHEVPGQVSLPERERLLRLRVLRVVRVRATVRDVLRRVRVSSHRTVGHWRADGWKVHGGRQRHVRQSFGRKKLTRPPLVPWVERRRGFRARSNS